jgi:hypothetical protein
MHRKIDPDLARGIQDAAIESEDLERQSVK